MRTYKFRAWDDVNKMFPIIGFHIMGEVVMFGLLQQYCLENLLQLKISQFTGYQDCNGVDIYEGDVIKCWDGILVIKFETFDIEQGYIIPLDDLDIEIIGNIFENPELDNQSVRKSM